MIKAVIFDLDGTIIDTEKIYRKAWPQAMKELGYEFSDERYLHMRSMGRPFSKAQFQEWYGEDFDYEGARDVRGRLFEEYIAENGIQPKAGAVELLTYLREKGIFTAIATATDMDRASRFIEMVGLTGYFDRVVSATMVDEGKPSPKVYEYVVSELGYDKDECLAVEDAPNGIKSAYSAGLKVIMVPDQSPCTDDLRDMIYAEVENLNEIKEFI